MIIMMLRQKEKQKMIYQEQNQVHVPNPIHVYKSLQDSWSSMQKLVPKHKGRPVRTTSLRVKSKTNTDP